MDKYEQIQIVGEGSYGVVMKCRHKETDQIVAIKKFLETEEDATIRKMALREIRMLKRLKHENLVAMIEVFRHRKRFYLVFEFLEGTVLDELEKTPSGLGEEKSRDRIFQVSRAINYCHSNNIIHRDVKPENVLVSSLGVVKLCDFGFARLVTMSGEPCTEYVATRWYRAPELLVGEYNYGPGVDIWAIGCLFAEMMTGDPLFPGESDIDQLFIIVKLLGKPCQRHQQLMCKNSQLRGIIKSPSSSSSGLDHQDLGKIYPSWSSNAVDFLSACVRMDPQERPSSDELLRCEFFNHDRFVQKFLPQLREKVNSEFNGNPLLRKHKTEILMSTDKKDEIRALNHGRKISNLGQGPGGEFKWKFNNGEGIKRKYSCDLFLENNGSNLITLSKSSQRLNVVQNKSGGKNQLESSTVDKQGGDENTFRSLQFGDFVTATKSPNILHPNITNINFSSDFGGGSKKSPNVGKNYHPHQHQQIPPLNPKTQQVLKTKASDRTHGIDIEIIQSDSSPWYNSTIAGKVKKEYNSCRKTDNFTLPNLPGATGSPTKTVSFVHHKCKKPPIGDSDNNDNLQGVTPRVQSSTSSHKHSPISSTLHNHHYQKNSP